MRVSKARGRDDLISPAVQRAEIERYATRQGLQVSEWFEDLDVSGRTDERPGLQAMIAEAQAGTFSAVVVYRLGRFSREPRDFYELVDRLTKAGVELHDAGETAFADTPEAELMRGIKIPVAKQESVKISDDLLVALSALIYDDRESRALVDDCRFTPHIRSRGEEMKDKLRIPGWRARRWVVEACHSWLNRNRAIRWSKKDENHMTLLMLASGLIAFKKAQAASWQAALVAA